MIERIEFKNFKVLRDTTLPLGRFTLIVGPNGSGKSTALEAFRLVGDPARLSYENIASHGGTGDITITLYWDPPKPAARTIVTCFEDSRQGPIVEYKGSSGNLATGRNTATELLRERLHRARMYHLNPASIAQPVRLIPNIELQSGGQNLAGVLDKLRDESPERFEALNSELNRCLPEFDRILFENPAEMQRSFSLRSSWGGRVAANDLSDGTLLVLAILTIAYLPDPPPIVAFEDPDRGIHPRLLRDVQDALYRLAYPENYGEDRDPVQVIATTHSPYFLDLFKDHPEEIVIAQKRNGEAVFEKLSDRDDIDDILADASLGDVWYSGILGGVPIAP